MLRENLEGPTKKRRGEEDKFDNIVCIKWRLKRLQKEIFWVGKVDVENTQGAAIGVLEI